jgi:hypothetical protein
MTVDFQSIYSMPMTIFSLRDLAFPATLVPPQTPLADLLIELAVLRADKILLIGSPGQRLGCVNSHDYNELSSFNEPLTRLY